MLFKKIIVQKFGTQSGSEAIDSPKEITNVEENILRYAAGYVLFASYLFFRSIECHCREY